MAHEVKIHPAQTSILRELLFRQNADFTALQRPTGLTSDHFNFHIQRLLALGFVAKKARGTYQLTPAGKEYANRLDTDQNTIERQPKLAVLLGIERRTQRGGRQFLLQERLKHPWYGFWGIPSGKVRWGETIPEAASRELFEETRLQADFSFAGVYHEQAILGDKPEPQEDKVFFVMRCLNPSGRLMARFEGGHNAWFSLDAASQLTPRFASFDLELEVVLGKHTLVEQQQRYKAQVF